MDEIKLELRYGKEKEFSLIKVQERAVGLTIKLQALP